MHHVVNGVNLLLVLLLVLFLRFLKAPPGLILCCFVSCFVIIETFFYF